MLLESVHQMMIYIISGVQRGLCLIPRQWPSRVNCGHTESAKQKQKRDPLSVSPRGEGWWENKENHENPFWDSGVCDSWMPLTTILLVSELSAWFLTTALPWWGMTISESKTTDLSVLNTKIELSAGRKNNLWFMVNGSNLTLTEN